MARRCLKCNHWNEDVDHCIKCGHVISLKLQEQQEQKEIRRRKELAPPESIDIFFDKFEHSRWLLIRIIFRILHSIWMVVVAIASFLIYFTAWTAG